MWALLSPDLTILSVCREHKKAVSAFRLLYATAGMWPSGNAVSIDFTAGIPFAHPMRPGCGASPVPQVVQKSSLSYWEADSRTRATRTREPA